MIFSAIDCVVSFFVFHFVHRESHANVSSLTDAYINFIGFAEELFDCETMSMSMSMCTCVNEENC